MEIIDKRQISFMLSLFLITAVSPVMAEDDITSDLICPCECAMIISTCDCPTAVQIKKEISLMKSGGFSYGQIYSALGAEYGKAIFVNPEKNISYSLIAAGISLVILLAFLGYIFSRRTKMDVMPDMKKYEQRFEDEYRDFVDKMDEINSDAKAKEEN